MGKSKELAELGQVVSQSNGNVGIGTDIPEQSLHIKGSNYNEQLVIERADTSSKWGVAGAGNGAFQVYDINAGNATRMTIDASGRVTMPYQPAFDAYDFTPRVGTGSIVWTNTRFNTGNHFNTSTGLFTAPVTGVYSFNFSILMKAGETVSYQRILFNINASRNTDFFDSLVGGSTGASGGAFEGYYYITLTGAKTMKLNANDSVGLWSDSPNDTWTSGNFGHFSGHLIG